MQRELVTRENSVKFRGWFSSHALGFVDALQNDCKDELKIAAGPWKGMFPPGTWISCPLGSGLL